MPEEYVFNDTLPVAPLKLAALPEVSPASEMAWIWPLKVLPGGKR